MSIFCYILLFLLTSIGVINAQQDSVVMHDNQIVIIMNGRATGMSISDRYIYRNDVDTAYALVVGRYYNQSDVIKAFGTPKNIQNKITESYSFIEGNINYIYDNLFLKIDYNNGLCNFSIDRDDVTFNYGKVPITIGNSFLLFEEVYPNPSVIKEPGKRTVDEKTGFTNIGVIIDLSGEDDWLILDLEYHTIGGFDIIYKSISYQQIN